VKLPAPLVPSSRHWNVEPAIVEAKENVDVVPVDADVIVVSGMEDVLTITVRVELAETLPAMSRARAESVREPPGTPENSRDQLPDGTATVPRETPLSNTSTVVPASAVPETVKSGGTEVPSAGAPITGAAGAVVSTRITRVADADEVPVAFDALALKRWSPSATADSIRVQLPEPFAIAVPTGVTSSKSSTVAFGVAVPANTSVLDVLQL
jgi:hypothetical protein